MINQSEHQKQQLTRVRTERRILLPPDLSLPPWCRGDAFRDDRFQNNFSNSVPTSRCLATHGAIRKESQTAFLKKSRLHSVENLLKPTLSPLKPTIKFLVKFEFLPQTRWDYRVVNFGFYVQFHRDLIWTCAMNAYLLLLS